MTTTETKVAVLESKLQNAERDIDELKKQRNWGVMALIGLVLQSAFDVFTKGGTP